MSGLVKSVGKVFSKVWNAVKTVAAPLLALGAIVFTGGAALGLAPLAAGWGGAVTAGLSAIGVPATGALGSILTGAATQAGYGAALGGIGSAISGGDPLKGAQMGALAGGLTGGIGGALSGAAATPAVGMSSRNAPLGLLNGTGPAAAAPAVPGTLAPASAATTAAAASPAIAGQGIWGRLASSPVVGQTIAGAAQGLLGGMAAKDAADAQRDEDKRIANSYDVDPSVYDTATPDTTLRPTPQQRWGRKRFQYDNASGKIVST